MGHLLLCLIFGCCTDSCCAFSSGILTRTVEIGDVGSLGLSCFTRSGHKAARAGCRV